MGSIRRCEEFPGTGIALFEAAREQGLEGIVAKRLDSTYQPGARSPAWVKIKAFRTMECVIGGWTAGQGGRTKTLGALLLGIYRDGKLMPGRTRRHRLRRANAPRPARDAEGARVADVAVRRSRPGRISPRDGACRSSSARSEYVEITRDGTLRHPVVSRPSRRRRPA